MRRTGLKLPEILTDDEVKAFLGIFNRRYIASHKNYMMCKLSLETGMRISEVINLKIQDIDWNTGRTHIKDGKGSQDRIVFINTPLLEELVKLRERCELGNTGCLFVTRTGTPLNRKNLDRMVKIYAEKAGLVKKLHFHIFRHTYATKVLRETGNLRTTQKILGHKNITNTVI